MTIHPDRRTELTEIMVELRRLGTQLVRLNRKYLDREALVTQWNKENVQNFTGNLATVLDNDIILNNASGAAKTVATIISGFSAVLDAELNWARMNAGRAVEAPPRRPGGPAMEPPIATRPQDWAEPARSMIFGEQAARARGERA